MPRRKIKETPEDTGVESANASDVAIAERPGNEPNHGDDAATPKPAAESNAGPQAKQFRSWVVDTERGYTRLSDEINHRIVLQFAEKPEPDILAVIKTAGFQFRPDYYGQKSCWVRRNDFEGRVQVENFERQFIKAAAAPDLPDY